MTLDQDNTTGAGTTEEAVTGDQDSIRDQGPDNRVEINRIDLERTGRRQIDLRPIDHKVMIKRMTREILVEVNGIHRHTRTS